jgi:opacity protein-like surface antigen
MRKEHDMIVQSEAGGSPRWISVVVLFLGLCVTAGANAAETDASSPRHAPKFYLSGLAGGSWVTGDAQGMTTGGGTIAGSSSASSAFGGAALGTTLDLRHVDLRLELEGTGGRSFQFAQPSNAGTFVTNVDVWTLQGNFWFEYPLRRVLPDVPILRDLAPFAGGGVGVSGLSMSTNGGGFVGSNDSTAFAWQGGAGLAYQPVEWLSFDVRYQYADLGGPSVTLQSGAATGNLDMDLGANEVIGAIRFTFAGL